VNYALAAHIDIDNVGAGGFRDPSALRHPVGLAARELNDMGTYSGWPRIAALDIGRPWTRSSLAVISDTTSPAPSSPASRRNGRR